MERSRRVYPVQRSRNGWLNGLMLFLSAVIILSGLVWRGGEEKLSIKLTATPTPIPLDEAFDETAAQADLTLPQREWYALQLGVFESKEAAEKLGEQYARRGAAGYVWLDGRYRTLAAVYSLKEDAQAVRQQLSEKHEVETYLYQIRLSEMQLRINGMQGQLEILQAAFAHADELVQSLQTLSMALDRQEKGVAELISAVRGISDQLTTVSLRLKQRFAAPRHKTVNCLIQCFDNFAEFASALDPDENEAGCGTKLKYQTFVSLEMLKQIYDSLSNT
ncbi:MAG: SPOR domain-containing protein [Clostridia bacterium]|nr:SPOR domain-containing protein [Clostridia bacterium]